MYSYNDRISYSEVDDNQNLTYHSLVNYMQDCSCFHSDDIGLGLKYLVPKKLGWFVTNYEIHINRMPVYSEKITISTYPYNFRGMMGSRKYTISNSEGEILAYADSLWILMNLETLKPCRIPEEFEAAYMQGDENPDLDFEGSRLRYSGGGEKVGEFVVTDMYIDTNGHMNNSYYIDVTRRFLPEGNFDTIKINYKKAALLDDELDVLLEKTESGYIVILSKEGAVYTIVEYK